MKINTISDGMLFEINSNNIIVHCKVIVAQIISYDVFINGCNLVYLYDVYASSLGERKIHNFNNLIGIKIINLEKCDLKAINFLGSEPINKWEANMDIGIRSINYGKWIKKNDISNLEHNHEIVNLGDKILAIPFFDVKNKQLDHIPLFQIEEGVTTIGGLLREISNM